MIFDELIGGVTEVVTNGIETIKDVTSDAREEVHDTNKAMAQAIKEILKTIKED